MYVLALDTVCMLCPIHELVLENPRNFICMHFSPSFSYSEKNAPVLALAARSTVGSFILRGGFQISSLLNLSLDALILRINLIVLRKPKVIFVLALIRINFWSIKCIG